MDKEISFKFGMETEPGKLYESIEFEVTRVILYVFEPSHQFDETWCRCDLEDMN